MSVTSESMCTKYRLNAYSQACPGKSVVRWTNRLDMIIAVDWDEKHQTNKQVRRYHLRKPREMYIPEMIHCLRDKFCPKDIDSTTEKWDLNHLGPQCPHVRKFWGLRTTIVQTSMPIHADWSAPLLFKSPKLLFFLLLSKNKECIFSFITSLSVTTMRFHSDVVVHWGYCSLKVAWETIQYFLWAYDTHFAWNNCTLYIYLFECSSDTMWNGYAREYKV